MFAALAILLPLGAALAKGGDRRHGTLQMVALAIVLVGVLLPTFGHASEHAHGELKTIAGHRVLGALTLVLAVVQGWAGHSVRLLRAREMAYGAGRTALAALRAFHKGAAPVLMVLPWFVAIWGVVGANGWCVEEERHFTGQCVAHFIKGPSFVLLAVAYTLQNLGRLRSWFPLDRRERVEAVALGIWGLVALTTEHRSFERQWNHTDQQHTAIGIYWLLASLCSLAHQRLAARPDPFPALALLLTGAQMTAHEVQISAFSRTVHKLFGTSLLCAALARLVALAGLKGADTLPPTFLATAGLLLGSATEEHVAWLEHLGVDPVSYAAGMAGVAFGIQAWVAFLVSLMGPAEAPDESEGGDAGYGELGRASEEIELAGHETDPEAAKNLFALEHRHSEDEHEGGSRSSSSGTANDG
ncbi:hypothetical protein DFJ74DRAFT_664285 [Hyaloraphidium curvatum]|nr:hypothetical protein DFJ74DRAFT_664285 [Hyaloraphidium curvatum]